MPSSSRFGELLAEPLRNGLTRPKRVRGSGTLMVNMGELFRHDRIGDIAMERVPLAERNPERDLLAPGDLLFARQSLVPEGAGKVSLFVGAPEPVTFESHLMRARADSTKASAAWLFYFFRSSVGRSLVASIVNQVGAAGIRGRDLMSLPIPAPSLAEQLAQASVLGALDRKIESDRRTGDLLASVVLTSAARAASSAHSRVPVGSFVEQVKAPGDPEAPYLGLDQMPRGSTVLAGWPGSGTVSGASWAFAAGDVLFGKLRPYFRKVAVAPIAGRCSREIVVLRPTLPQYYGLVVGTVASQAFIDYCTQISSGTKMPRAEWAVASTFEVGVPDDERLAELDVLARANYSAIAGLLAEARSLTAIRDALLPKLVSGQIRVPLSDDPDEQVGAAVEALG